MSLIHLSQSGRLRSPDDPGGTFPGPTFTDQPPTPITASVEDVSWERRRAHDDVDAELAGPGPSSGESAVATRGYADGHLVMGISGPVDRAMARRIGAQLHDLRPHSTRGLLIVLTRLGAWNPHLARVLGQARIQHLIDGGAFEVYDAPAGLLTALRAGPAFDRPPTVDTDPGPLSPAGRNEHSDLGRADRSAG